MNYCQIIYDEIKCRYVQKYGKRGFFYQDYFENAADGLQSFIESLNQYEDWLDLTRKPTEDDLDTVWEHISEGIFRSAVIMRQVDSVTDKYIGDN